MEGMSRVVVCVCAGAGVEGRGVTIKGMVCRREGVGIEEVRRQKGKEWADVVSRR